MWPNPQETADLVTFSEEILNGKLHFLCTERLVWKQNYDVLDDTPDDDVLDVDKNYTDYIDYNDDNDDIPDDIFWRKRLLVKFLFAKYPCICPLVVICLTSFKAHPQVWDNFWQLKASSFTLTALFCSQNIQIFVLTFWSCRKTAWLER